MKSLPWNVIASVALAVVLVVQISVLPVRASADVKRRVDSLFIIASSGEVQYRDQNEPAMDSIAALGASAVPFLIDKFATRSARERWTIIWTLQRIGSPAVPDLVTALRGSDPLIVGRVAWALGDIGDADAAEPLIVVSGHTEWQVRDRSLTALGKIGDRRAAESVVDGLKDSVGQVRKSAAVACGRIELEEAMARLVHMLGDRFYGARMAALEALLSMDTATVITTLTDSVESANRLVGHLACEIFSRLSTDVTQDLLLAQTYSTDAIRRAHAAVGLIRSDPDDNCGFLKGYISREANRLAIIKVQSAAASANDTRE